MKTNKQQRYPDRNQRKVSANDTEHFCCVHESRLIPGGSQYGIVYRCQVDGCDVIAWSGSTSTPATQEVRKLRVAAHSKFDLIWRCGILSRTKAYMKLSCELKIPRSRCHVGMMNKEECISVISFSERMLSGFNKYA